MNPTDSQAYRLALTAAMDPEASARATGSIEIDAPREAVWDAVAHVANWPRIRSDIADPATDGPPATGTTFAWTANGARLASAFALVERPRRLTWANTAPGLTMTCVYDFDDVTRGRSRIRCEESMSAMVVAPQIDDAALAASIRTWLAGIKAFVETARPS